LIRPTRNLGGLEFEELRRCPFFVAMAPGHPLLRMKKIPVETLAAQPMVVLRRRIILNITGYCIKSFRRCAPTLPPKADGINSLITEVGIGTAVAMVSQIFKEAIGKRLCYRPLANTTAAQSVGIARAKNGDVTPPGKNCAPPIRKVA